MCIQVTEIFIKYSSYLFAFQCHEKNIAGTDHERQKNLNTYSKSFAENKEKIHPHINIQLELSERITLIEY